MARWLRGDWGGSFFGTEDGGMEALRVRSLRSEECPVPFLEEAQRSPLGEGALGSTSMGSDFREGSGRGDWLFLSGLTLLTTSGLGMLENCEHFGHTGNQE